ncbi:FKBP-type peptidyl-prolyl cis-trans isomerase [Mucilaginibacter sp.]
MKKTLMFLALASVGLASCNGGFKKGDGGMLYDIYVDKGGPKIQSGDFVSVNLIAKRDDDSVLFSTYETGRAVQTLVPKPQFKGDIFTGLQQLAQGDSATIKIDADSMFKKGQQRPPTFKGKYLVYTIKVDKVIPKGTLSDQVFQAEITDYMKAQAQVFKLREPAAIKKYIADNKLNVKETPDSLYYVITQPGTGPTAAVGDTAVVNYTGKLLNGKVFDTSVKDEAVKGKLPINPMGQYKPIHIPVGQKRVIPGWDEGLQLLNKGAKAIFVIPSNLAYGERGMSVISPYTPIAFEIEMVDIIKPNPNAPKPVAPVMPNIQQLQHPAPVKK